MFISSLTFLRLSFLPVRAAFMACPKAAKSYKGTGLFAIIIHPTTFYCSFLCLDMSTLFYQLTKIIHMYMLTTSRFFCIVLLKGGKCLCYIACVFDKHWNQKRFFPFSIWAFLSCLFCVCYTTKLTTYRHSIKTMPQFCCSIICINAGQCSCWELTCIFLCKRRNIMLEKYWIKCPICNGKTRVQVFYNTVLRNFPLFCPKCKLTHIVDVEKLEIIIKNSEKQTF